MGIFFTNIDTLVVILYFAVVLYLGLLSSRKISNNVDEYFLAGRSLGWFAIGTSLYATIISMEQFLVLTDISSNNNFSLSFLNWSGFLFIILLGWFVAPKIIKAKVFTIPQYIGNRFDKKARMFFAITSVFVFSLLKIIVSLVAGGIILNSVLGWDVFNSFVIILLFTGIYTLIGGMHAVKNTHIFQAILIFVSVVLLGILGYTQMDGHSAITTEFSTLNSNIFSSFNTFDLNFIGTMFGGFILGVWYWCSDQYIFQRVLSGKNIKEVKKGSFFASFLFLITLLFLLFLSYLVMPIYPQNDSSNLYEFLFNSGFIPNGVKGIILVGFFSALMSTLSSSFSSAAAIFTLDIYPYFKKRITDIEYILVGRLSTIVIIIISITTISTMKLWGDVSHIHFEILQAYIAPPIVSIFLIGLLWNDASKSGAIWALLIGSLIGYLKVALAASNVTGLKDAVLLWQINSLDPYLFSIISFIITSLVYISISKIFSIERFRINEPIISKKKSIRDLSIDIVDKQIKEMQINNDKSKSEMIH